MTSLLFADFDLEKIEGERLRHTSFADAASRAAAGSYGPSGLAALQPVPVEIGPWDSASFSRNIDPHPFVPKDPARLDERCREIFSIQSAALAKRLGHCGARKAVVGVSGGLDSALALLVAAKTMDILKRPRGDVLALTMPGFGTTDGTLPQARALITALGASVREIDIKEACALHFRDIGHDPSVHDVTYENVQARERTQILMDVANAEGGIVVGTGDLSEAALGWSTYNGDHMSMYAVNSGVPKTLVRHLVSWVASTEAGRDAAAALASILDTPVSPELLPPDASGKIAQRTEDIIGPYELHDFFLYHVVRWGASPEKTAFLAEKAFAGKYGKKDIGKWLGVFLKRFFSQQFKRSCVPDGPKVGSVSLSPRGDWRMPSDASGALWEGRG
jgi:NAD+ synthase (glutamine-hydrolysing)